MYRIVVNSKLFWYQVVPDCTGVRCQTPNSSFLQRCSLPTSHICTFTGMTCTIPHDAVTFVSSLYEGSVSNRKIPKQSGIVSLFKRTLGKGGFFCARLCTLQSTPNHLFRGQGDTIYWKTLCAYWVTHLKGEGAQYIVHRSLFYSQTASVISALRPVSW